MMYYVKIGALCAILLDMEWSYSAKPVIAVKRHNEEHIMDVPFCRIIYTPARVLKRNNLDKDSGFDKENSEHRREQSGER